MVSVEMLTDGTLDIFVIERESEELLYSKTLKIRTVFGFLRELNKATGLKFK